MCHYGKVIRHDDYIVGDVFIVGPTVDEESTDASASMVELMLRANGFNEPQNVYELLNWIHIVSAIGTKPENIFMTVQTETSFKAVHDPILTTLHQLRHKEIPSRLEVDPHIWYKPIRPSEN